MIEVIDKEKYMIDECSICSSTNDTITFALTNDTLGVGHVICLCKECRDKLIKVIRRSNGLV